MIISAANNLNNKKQSLNDLNVFPVPDGDTGTNMSLTMAAAKTMLATNKDETLEAVSAAVANSLIRGARGNSGVILSLLFRGISKGFKGCKEADAATFAKACNLGVEAAYKAVMKPTEGTILTVSRLAAQGAIAATEKTDNTEKVFSVLLKEGQKALDKTPEILPVLKQAGVVDAGGQGFMVAFEGMYEVLKNGRIIEAVDAVETAPKADFEQFDTESINFAYCTEFIIDKKDINSEADEFRSYLHSIGDCVVVVDAGDFIKTHVHTNNPGKALEAAVELGSLSKIKIENMKEQHTALSEDMVEAASKQLPEEEEIFAAAEKKYGFVAVCAGAGFAEVFSDLCVDNIIEGGQTMNPSTDNILKAINKTPSEVVFVLPNNKNIIMAAQQCVDLTEKKVIVIPTKTVPQGITAMLSFDPDADEETNEAALTEACSYVKTLSVTYAARDSEFDGLHIEKGQYLGMIEGKVDTVSQSLNECVTAITEKALSGDEAFVNVFYGSDANENEAEEVKDIIANKLTGADINVVNGGQPVYYYVISVE